MNPETLVENTAALAALADRHGSDKGFGVGLRHGYVRVYGGLLSQWRRRKLKLLEIGLSRDRNGANCPSLAMWADWAPAAEVLGIDIDDYSSFSHQRCRTRIVDQTDRNALTVLAREEGPFDLIIDDGAHLSDAQQLSFFTLFPALRPGGLYFIEDLHWQPASEPGDAMKTRSLFQNWAQGLRPETIAWLAQRHGAPRARIAACLAEIAALQFFDSLAPGRPPSQMADALLAIKKAA